jgi:hypothetical protein
VKLIYKSLLVLREMRNEQICPSLLEYPQCLSGSGEIVSEEAM